MRALGLLVLVTLSCACEGESREAPKTPVDYARLADPDDDHGAHVADEALPAGEPEASTAAPSRVLVLQSSHLDRPTEILGVVDAHETMGHHDAALEALKRRAAALGADAVIGVEFHHGEGEGEPTHLSGLAVRFLPSLPFAHP